MKPNRLDDIFQIFGGIPIICGLYIGMDKTIADKKMQELLSYKLHHYYDYPCDLIYKMCIDFECEFFEDSECIKSCQLSFPIKTGSNSVNYIKQYIKEKYYYRRNDEYIQCKAYNKILSYMVDIYNEFYHFTIYSTDDSKMCIQLRANILDESIYHALNIVSTNIILKNKVIESLNSQNDKELLYLLDENIDIYLLIIKLISYNQCKTYFDGLNSFYIQGGETQDAVFNELRAENKSFKDAIKEFYKWQKKLITDNEIKDVEIYRNQFLDLWNTPGSVIPNCWKISKKKKINCILKNNY